jgi:hypothetical protein
MREQLINQDIRNELAIFPLYEKITECREKWKIHLQRMEHSNFPLVACKYCDMTPESRNSSC